MNGARIGRDAIVEALDRLVEVETRTALECSARFGGPGAIRRGEVDLAALGHATGLRVLEDACAAHGIDAEALLELVGPAAEDRARATLEPFGLRAEGQWAELVNGVAAAGLLTGVRLGLDLADRAAR